MGVLGFKISWFQLFIYIFALKFLFFPSSVFCQNNACFKVCLHFQLFVYIFSCLFIYFFVSWLFTFFSCLFTIWIFTPKSCFSHQSFVKIMLQSLKSQMFVYIFSCLFTFSAVCLLFCQLILHKNPCFFMTFLPQSFL